MPARPSSCVFVVVALSLAACAGSDPDQAVRDYYVAIVHRDGARACDQLSAELRREIERAPAARRAGRTCADVMELAVGLNPRLKAEDVEELDIDVEEDGDEAFARLDSPLVGTPEELDLVKQDGDWKISTLENRPRE